MYLWKDVRDGWDKDVGAADASLDEAPQGLPTLQSRPAVHHDHAELPVFLEGLAQDVVDQRRAEQRKMEVVVMFREENVEGSRE